jgi:large subunit ribosomal protein L25
MSEIVVAAESRAETGKGPNGRLRSRGMIPGIVYGAGKKAVSVAVSPREIGDILRSASGENTLFDIEVDGERRKVILKQFQREPLKGQLIHADFFEMALDKRIEVKVHIELVGTPVGVKTEGGLLEFITRELDVECLPTEIPDKFSLDVSELELGRHLRVSEVVLPSDRITLLTDPDVVIAHVVTPRAEVAATEAEEAEAAAAAEAEGEGAEGAEPEVAKKGKGEDEAAEAKPRKKEK